MSLRTSAHTGVAIRPPRPPWLPLWGSCHEVTERVNKPSPPLPGAPLPWGEARSSSVSRLRGTREPPLHYGMIATGNHLDFDSLRGAPPRRGRLRKRIATSASGLPRNDMRLFWCRKCGRPMAAPTDPYDSSRRRNTDCHTSLRTGSQ